MKNVLCVENNVVFECFNRKIKVSVDVISIWKKYIQEGLFSKEAGGVLIGRESRESNNLIIEFCTNPMLNDVRKRTRFFRRDKKHIEYFTDVYNDNEGIYRYVGEWHTHPEDVPSYSSLDKKNWKKIFSDLDQNEQFHFIIGRKGVTAWRYNGTSSITKIGFFSWEEYFKNE